VKNRFLAKKKRTTAALVCSPPASLH